MGRLVRGVNDLSTVRPDLAAEWHPTNNADVSPRDVTFSSGKKAWWLCAQGHEWEAVVNNRDHGTGCPYCHGRFAIIGESDLATTNPNLAAEWHPTNNGRLTPFDVKSSTGKKVWWLCGQGHEWEAVVSNRHNGRNCPFCSGNQVLVGFNDLATTNPDLAAEWHPTKNGDLSPRDITSGSNQKAWWLCGEGHEWAAVIGNRNGGRGCPICDGKQVLVGFNDLQTTNPDLAAEWHPAKNSDLTPRDVSSGSHKKAWWLCALGHEWETTIGDRNIGRGCPYCSGYLVIRGETDLCRQRLNLRPKRRAKSRPLFSGSSLPVLGF
jgi:hypothetical protein